VEAEHEWDERIMSGETSPFAVAFFDLNGLKTINDTFGHAAGDAYIKSGCAHICTTFQHSPVYRVGGDEFAAILTGGDYENRAELKARFQAENGARHFPDEAVTACGMSDYIPGEDSRFQDVLERADVDMYEDKKRLKK
jgi:diguanylate cyclase (GGDEF)-like protein